MKKKTVITTEKREVWVIRQPASETEERETVSNATEPSVNSLIVPLDRQSGPETPPDEQN